MNRARYGERMSWHHHPQPPGVDWGSVADWVSGLATAGALAIALVILIRELRLQKRAVPDAFVTWYTRSFEASTDKGTNYGITVYGYNGGSTPIPYAFVQSPEDTPTYSLEALNAKGDDDGLEPITPNQTVKVNINFGDNKPDRSDFIVHFSDGRGGEWYRHLDTNVYLNNKKWEAIKKNPGKHRWQVDATTPF